MNTYQSTKLFVIYALEVYLKFGMQNPLYIGSWYFAANQMQINLDYKLLAWNFTVKNYFLVKSSLSARQVNM